jgi:hypothetical protein
MTPRPQRRRSEPKAPDAHHTRWITCCGSRPFMSAWSSRSSSLTALASLEGLAPVCVLSETARQISRLVRTCDIALLLRHLTQFRYHAAWREPPVSFGVAPAGIVEGHVGSILRIEVTVTDDNGTRTGHLASQTEIRAAAEWAWIIFRDLFGESIHQPATRMATMLSSTRCSRCDAPTSSSGCRPCPDPRSCIRHPAPPRGTGARTISGPSPCVPVVVPPTRALREPSGR